MRHHSGLEQARIISDTKTAANHTTRGYSECICITIDHLVCDDCICRFIPVFICLNDRAVSAVIIQVSLHDCIRSKKSFPLIPIISAPQIIIPGLLVPDIPPIPERLHCPQCIGQTPGLPGRLAPGIIGILNNLGPCAVNQRHHIALQVIQIPISRPVEDNNARFPLRVIVEVQLIRSPGQVSDVLAMEHIFCDGFCLTNYHCLLRPQAVFVYAMALWWFLGGGHGVTCFPCLLWVYLNHLLSVLPDRFAADQQASRENLIL